MVQRLTQAQAASLALAHSPDRWWRAALQNAAGVRFEASFTRQQAWMETQRFERRYLSSDRAHSLPKAEPLAPPEYTDATLEWVAALGDLVECPTCTGNGRTTCKQCKGQERVACPRCAHLTDHRPPCARCGGYESHTCTACDGRGYESPCLKCEGSRFVRCPTCVGLGNTSCEKCDGNSRVYEVDTVTKTYKTTSSLKWQDCPRVPDHVATLVKRHLPMRTEEPLDKPDVTEVAVLGIRRLHHHGTVEVVRYARLLTKTIVRVGGRTFVLPRGVAKAMPAEWFSAAQPAQTIARRQSAR